MWKQKYANFRDTITFLGYVITQVGVEKDLSKVWAVTECSLPTMIKELQHFLGFANFYRRFIWNYSLIATSLTTLLWGKHKRLHWTQTAKVAFKGLKASFTTAPILKHPHPKVPFLVKVDASSCGIEMVKEDFPLCLLLSEADICENRGLLSSLSGSIGSKG